MFITDNLFMAKMLISVCVLLGLAGQSAEACTVCGCGVGNYHYGILPQFRKNFVGVRYRHSSYVSTLDGSHASAFSHETFQSAELWGRVYPTKKIQAFLFVPVNFNERIEGSEVKTLRGLGDVVISANYNLINSYDSADNFLKHNLLVGGGLKLPTGQYRAIENGQTINQNFQLGTGSLDFLFNIIYTVRHNNIGLNSEFTYSWNTTNKDEYRFGNASRVGITVFYILRARSLTIMPHVGISGEFFNDNRQFNVQFPDTGGWASLCNIGTEVYYRNLALGISYSHPGKQALFNEQVHANDRVSAHLTVMF
jgi:hypothetical protein